jgi:hypothetical protein
MLSAVIFFKGDNRKLLSLTILYNFIIDQDTATILTYDDFFPGFYIELSLRRNLVKATATGITLD